MNNNILPSRILPLVLSGAAMFLAATCSADTTRYRIVELSSAFPNGSARATDISNSGEVAGTSYDENDQQCVATIWSRTGSITILPFPIPSGSNSWAMGINAGGSVVGGFPIADRISREEARPLLWVDGMPTRLPLPPYPVPPPGQTLSLVEAQANAISDSGYIVGQVRYDLNGVSFHPLRWAPPSMTVEDLPTLGGGGFANAVNNYGAVAGGVLGSDGYYKGAVWTPTGQLALVLQPLPGGLVCHVVGFNDNGDVVGNAHDGQCYRAVIWPAGQDIPSALPLPTPTSTYSSTAYDINAKGEIVGVVSSTSPAILWRRDQSIVDLAVTIPNNSGWDLRSACSINNQSMITGAGMKNGQYAQYLLVRSGPVEAARQLIGAPYLLGGKGRDFDRPHYPAEGLVDSARVLSGYDYCTSLGCFYGSGIDCSGLVQWSYKQAFGDDAIADAYEGCKSLYDHIFQTVIQISERQPGDVIFYGGPTPNGLRVTHVAMYAGNDEVIESTRRTDGSGLVGVRLTPLSVAWNRVDRLELRRHSSSGIVSLLVQTYSPITLRVTDPDGYSIDSTTGYETAEEIQREASGTLYYSAITRDGRSDDAIVSPQLKQGRYQIQVYPKPDAAMTDTFGLEVTTPATSLLLADQVEIAEIPIQGYGVLVDGTGLTEYLPVLVDVKPGTLGPAPINTSGNGVTPIAILSRGNFNATDIDVLSLRAGPNLSTAIRNTVEDIDHDGQDDLLVHFRTRSFGLTPADNVLCITATALGGQIFGCDSIRVVP